MMVDSICQDDVAVWRYRPVNQLSFTRKVLLLFRAITLNMWIDRDSTDVRYNLPSQSSEVAAILLSMSLQDKLICRP